MPRDEVQRRYGNIREAMARDGLDAIVVSGNGSHTVTYYSVDLAGNTESAESTPFTIQTLPPRTTATLSGPGIPDLTGSSPVSPKDREEFRKTIESVVKQNEPRLKKLRVKLIESSQSIDRTIRFHIDAVLHAEPAPEPISFDSTLRLADGLFEVKGEANA